MDQEKCTLFSSGLKGAETSFGETAEKWGVKEVIYSFETHKLQRERNVILLSQEELERGDISMELASRMLNRTYYETKKIRKVLQTIFHMINGGHQVFVIGTIQDDKSVKGGTGWAVELAKMFNRPLHVYDQPNKKWFTWKNDWVEDEPTIEYDTFVGSGTRYLSDAGHQAIEDLFARSFKETN
ncbi:hypothetical protein [Desulfotalea psychrophila]|uniref:Uncharacterized protein n=1 Tax=Desulfotalea psychrophila (strain LSv54 / DSM 12343) TaxID=177439 RepID=Q6AIK8_DESPS|nr:hypothetical protein [Desulfotalea psychrophila]CAG37822.1 unknown protein [Desulfotalea psychrophila LSv54]